MVRNTLYLALLFVLLASCSAPGGSNTAAAPQARFAEIAVEDNGVVQAQPAVFTSLISGPAAAKDAVAAEIQPAAAQPADNAADPAAPAEALTAEASSASNTQISAPPASGPDQFPEGVSPLTGLPVKNKANLALSPALVSVTNFPVTARPQAGLSFSPFVYEMYIGEGMTRFLAVFYGDYPEKGQNNGIALADDRVGPIRSGRLPYESLRKLYNGFLVMASASPNVLSSLGGYTTVFGSDQGDINSAMIPATRLAEIASKNPARLKSGALSGLRFASEAPAGEKVGKMLWIPYNFLNQVMWRYDETAGAYLRYQDNADGKTFIQARDRLNDQPLAYSNVVVLFANHQARRETLIDINLMYQNKMPALLFRDGKMYEIFWTTANGKFEKTTGLVRPIRFIDAQGNPFPLKPGQTWVEIVQQYTQYNETVDSQSYFDLKTKTSPGSGAWAVHFFPPIPDRK